MDKVLDFYSYWEVIQGTGYRVQVQNIHLKESICYRNEEAMRSKPGLEQ